MVLPPPLIASIAPWTQNVPPPLEGLEPLFLADVPYPFEILIQDGERVIGASVPDYSVGKLDVESGSNKVALLKAWVDDTGTVTYAFTNPGGSNQLDPRNTPVLGKWLENREIIFDDDPIKYLVVAVLDLDIDGVYDAMWVAQGETLLPPMITAQSSYTILGFPNSIFYTCISTLGIFPEQWPLTNRLDLDMQGDEITGMCHAGEFLLIIGRRTVVYLLQNHGAIDDVPTNGSAFSSPRYVYGCPGCQAPRSIAQLPNNTAMWLSPSGQIALATAAGVIVHPLSQLFRGWISGRDKVDTDRLSNSHAVWVPQWQWYVLFLVEDKETTQTNSGGGLEYQNLTPPSDPFNGGFTTDDPPVPIETPVSALTCNDYGHTIDRTTPAAQDFSRILILDTVNKCIYVGWGWTLSCSLAHSSPCASPAMLPEYILGGGIDGYISKLFADDCFGLGTPNNRVKWPGQAASTTFDIDAVALGEFFQADSLIGLGIFIHFQADDNGPDRFQTNTISANTNTQLSFTTSITDYDSVDYVLIAPMTCGLVFGEVRTLQPSTILSILMDVWDDQVEEQEFLVDILAAPGQTNVIEFTGPQATLPISTTDLQQGQGTISLPQVASKALSVGIRFVPTGEGVLQVGPVSVTQFLKPGEQSRNQEK